MDFFCKIFILGFSTAIVFGQDCTTQYQNCTAVWKDSMAKGKDDIDMECAAVIVYAACLKKIETGCSADIKTSIESLLNKELLPILSGQCQAQSCEVEFAGCLKNWQQATGASPDVASKCKETEEYMTCLLNIESTCTADQINNIRGVLNDIGPKVNKACRGKGCSVQSSMCIAVWNVSLSDDLGNNELACNANEAFDVCLRAIEEECTPDERKAIDTLVGKINPTLYAKCQGSGCTPMLYECVSKLNNTLQSLSSPADRCSGYQIYEQCLNNVEVLCNNDEKSTVQNDLKIIKPLISQLCSDNGASSSEAMMLPFFLYFVYSLL